MNFYPDTYLLEEFFMVALPVLTSVIPSSALGIATYVLTSMSLYALSSRRGIEKAWISWVPVLNVWIIGSLSDQYRYVVKGQYRSKRKLLLVLNLLNLLIGFVMVIICIFTAIDVAGRAIYGAWDYKLIGMLMGPGLSILGLSLSMAGIAIAAAVVRYMAMYDIYTSMDPANSVIFLVLSIIFHVTEPFFLFFSRNKDNGMPPRRPEAQWQPQEPVSGAREEEKDYL